MPLWLRKLTPFGRTGARPFLDSPSPLVDGDLELIEPAARWIDSVLLTTQLPSCRHDPAAQITRNELIRFIERCPRGRQAENPVRDVSHGYTFWMRARPGSPIPVEMAGSISLRIGDDENLRMYLGHIGYGVYPPARGHHFAERATRLILPLAKAHGLRELWITANPENAPSRRTCERLGATLVDVVKLPTSHPLALRGETHKCRYRLDLK